MSQPCESERKFKSLFSLHADGLAVITDRLSYLLMGGWDETERSGNTLDLNQDVFNDSRCILCLIILLHIHFLPYREQSFRSHVGGGRKYSYRPRSTSTGL